MNEETRNAVPGGDYNHIYEMGKQSGIELGKLSGEVKVLKWGAAISVTMLFAYLTLLSYQITEWKTSLERQNGAVREEVSALRTSQERQLSELRTSHEQQLNSLRTSHEQQLNSLRTSHEQQLGELREGQTFIRERLGVIEQRVTGMDQRITTNEQRIGALSHL